MPGSVCDGVAHRTAVDFSRLVSQAARIWRALEDFLVELRNLVTEGGEGGGTGGDGGVGTVSAMVVVCWAEDCPNCPQRPRKLSLDREAQLLDLQR
jgi:hypothetical protein